MEEQPLTRRRLLGAVGTALAGGIAGCSFGQSPESTASGTSTPTSGPDSPSTSGGSQAQTQDGDTGTRRLDDDAAQSDSPYTGVYEQVVDSVVAVRVEQFGSSARGTAWVYGEDHLVTNQHVVADSDSVSVWFDDDGWREATVVGTDVYSDLAALKVSEMPPDATPLPLVERDPPIGTQVLAIGNPFGLTGSLSSGVVSGRNRTLPAANDFSIPDAVQTDAAVNPGNSGGPLVDLDGNVVGVINSGGGDNIGFAISAAMVRRVVPELIENGEYEHSYMGVSLTEVTPRIVEANDLPVSRGVYIDDILEGGPSEGVLEGSTDSQFIDGQTVPTGGDVVVRMGQTEIRTTQTLSTFLALETSPGDTIEIGVVRDGQRETVQLTLGSRPEP
ncbi:MAG: serine protease Do [Haloarculaceae archaeon]|jgi:serine protease Do